MCDGLTFFWRSNFSIKTIISVGYLPYIKQSKIIIYFIFITFYIHNTYINSDVRYGKLRILKTPYIYSSLTDDGSYMDTYF